MHYILRRVFFCFLSLALVAGTIACGWVQGMRRDISASVLRLHIVANSDSGFDQTVKHQVRDRILTDSGFLFAGSPSAAAMHSTIWPEVEPEVELFLAAKLTERAEQVLARAKRKA